MSQLIRAQTHWLYFLGPMYIYFTKMSKNLEFGFQLGQCSYGGQIRQTYLGKLWALGAGGKRRLKLPSWLCVWTLPWPMGRQWAGFRSLPGTGCVSGARSAWHTSWDTPSFWSCACSWGNGQGWDSRWRLSSPWMYYRLKICISQDFHFLIFPKGNKLTHGFGHALENQNWGVWKVTISFSGFVIEFTRMRALDSFTNGGGSNDCFTPGKK